MFRNQLEKIEILKSTFKNYTFDNVVLFFC